MNDINYLGTLGFWAYADFIEDDPLRREFGAYEDGYFSVRLANILYHNDIRSWLQLSELTELEFITIKNAGRKTLQEAREQLAKVGLSFRGKRLFE